jgi:DNA gyrase/topoisomerase IV subunit A
MMRLVFGAFATFAVGRDLISHLRGTDVTLKVTNFDLIRTGHAPDGYSPSSIPRASIYNLDFRESISQYGKIIRIDTKSIRAAGRSTQGVKLLNLEADDKVSAAVVIPPDESKSEPETGMLLQ